ncbi:hypothetical protein [Verticiella sediminum]|uniref:hypothetical protein n=1 Tax=Verticiella sediminum TaxID=1247510 RepID=UPI001478E147|nr:hypothetical protein [Verticiella sediminum]
MRAVLAVALLSIALPTFAATDADVQRAVQRAADQAVRQAKQQQARAEREERQRAAQAEREARQRQAQAQREANAQARQETLARSCASLQAWVDAEPIPFYTGHRPSEAAIAAMLRDARFVPIFGQRYDEMDRQTLQQLAQGASRCFAVPNGPLAALPAREKQLVNSALAPGQQPANLQHLARAREADATLLRLASAATGLQPTEPDAQRLLAMEREGEAVFAMAAQAARERFLADLRAADTAVAVPVLAAAVDQALASAQGLDGLQALATLAHRQQAGFMPAGERLQSTEGVQARAENLRRIQQRMDAIGEALAATERQRIDALGEGAVALEQGVRWHADYLQRLQPYAARVEPLAGLLPYFTQKREQALAQARETLQRQAAGTASHEELHGLQARYLLPQDQQTVPGMAILTAFTAQAQAVDKRIALGRSGVEPEQPAPSKQAAPQAAAGEPSEDVMYDLVRSVLDTGTRRQNALMAGCLDGPRTHDPAMNQVCLATMLYAGVTSGTWEPAPPPKILAFEKIGCAPALGQAGYQCDYRLAVEKRLNPALVGPEAQRLLEGASLKQARFIEGRNGWMMIYTDEAVQ